MNGSFTGTPECMAPETVLGTEYDERIDFWQFGILLYEMLNGYTPFEDPDRNFHRVFSNIVNEDVVYPIHMSEEAKDLISKLLEKDPNDRLTNFNDIRDHKFFNRHKRPQIF